MSVSLAVYVWIRDIDRILLKNELAHEVASMLAADFSLQYKISTTTTTCKLLKELSNKQQYIMVCLYCADPCVWSLM